MENCKRCRLQIKLGATLAYGQERHRFCSGTCAITWSKVSGPGGVSRISFDPKPKEIWT